MRAWRLRRAAAAAGAVVPPAPKRALEPRLASPNAETAVPKSAQVAVLLTVPVVWGTYAPAVDASADS